MTASAQDDRVAAIGTRTDALAGSARLWGWVAAIAAGGFFEIYDLSLTPSLSAGLGAVHIFKAGRAGLFGLPDQANFISATFLGLYLGVVAFSAFGDRLGRKAVFGWSLLWYAAATLVMGLQSDALSICFWRFVAGVGIGAEAVAIDCYVVEITPARLRGRAFSVSMAIQYLATPTAAILAALLIPRTVAGVEGWRWLTVAPVVGALAFWLARRRLPESPRWLASRGRFAEAEAILDQLPAAPAAPPAKVSPKAAKATPTASRSYLLRVLAVLFIYFNLQNIAYYGFANWVPALLQSEGVPLKRSLLYSAGVALAAPVAPLLLATVADRFERKHLILVSGLGSVALGLLFAWSRSPPGWLTFGIGLSLANAILSVNSHNYLGEVFPTRVRARAAGFVYSFTRIGAALSAYLIAFVLAHGGVTAVFVTISTLMGVALAAVLLGGPRTRNRSADPLTALALAAE